MTCLYKSGEANQGGRLIGSSFGIFFTQIVSTEKRYIWVKSTQNPASFDAAFCGLCTCARRGGPATNAAAKSGPSPRGPVWEPRAHHPPPSLVHAFLINCDFLLPNYFYLVWSKNRFPWHQTRIRAAALFGTEWPLHLALP